MEYAEYLRKYNPSGNVKSSPESSYEDYQNKYGSKESEEESFVALSYKDYVNKYAAKEKAKEKWVKEQLAKPTTIVEQKVKPSIPQKAGVAPIEISPEERAKFEKEEALKEAWFNPVADFPVGGVMGAMGIGVAKKGIPLLSRIIREGLGQATWGATDISKGLIKGGIKAVEAPALEKTMAPAEFEPLGHLPTVFTPAEEIISGSAKTGAHIPKTLPAPAKGVGKDYISVYRASLKPFDRNRIKEGIYVSPSKQIADYFKTGERKVEELFLAKDAKILEYKDIPEEIKNIKDWDKYSPAVAKYAKGQGYDAVYSTPEQLGIKEPIRNELTIVNPNKIYTKGEITLTEPAKGVGKEPVVETAIYKDKNGNVIGEITGKERSVYSHPEFEKIAFEKEHTHFERGGFSLNDINLFIKGTLRKTTIVLPDGKKWSFVKPTGWKYPQELSGYEVKEIAKKIEDAVFEKIDPHSTFDEIWERQTQAIADKFGFTFKVTPKAVTEPAKGVGKEPFVLKDQLVEIERRQAEAKKLIIEKYRKAKEDIKSGRPVEEVLPEMKITAEEVERIKTAAGQPYDPLKGEKGAVQLTRPKATSPAIDAVKSMIGKPKKEKFSLLDRMRQTWTDRGAFLETFVKEAKNLSPAKIKAEEDPYILFRNYAGRMGKVEAAHDQLRTIIAPIKHYQHELETYLLSQRTIERANRGLKNPAKVDAQTASQAIDDIKTQISPKAFQEIEKSAQGFYKWSHDNILQPAKDSGLISNDTYQKIISENKNWLPFNVIKYLDDIERLKPGAEVFSVASQDVIKAMKGTEELIEAPFDAVTRRLVNAVSTIERNNVGRKFVELKDKIPGYDQIIRTLKSTEKPKEGEEIFHVFMDGKVNRFAIPQDTAISLKQLNPSQVDGITRFASATNAAFRAGATTLYLPFTISNAVRDFYMAKIASRVGFSVVDWAKGFKEAAKSQFGFESKLYDDFLKNMGGMSGYVGSLKKPSIGTKKLFESNIARAGKVVINPFELISRVSQTIELTPRLGVYGRAIGKGASGTEAAFAARTGTIDFAKAGTLMKVINQWIPFLNARVQGRLNVANAFKDRPIRSAFKVGTLAMMPGIATYAWNRTNYSDLYDEIPQYVKDNYFTLITGETKDKEGNRVPQYFKIPKGDIGQMFYNPVEYALDYAFKKGDQKNVQEFLTNFLNDISPVEFAREGKPSITKMAASALPPFVRTPLEVGTEESFYTGFPMIPERLKKVAPELQYTEYTPKIYKKIGQALGISPIKLHYGMAGMFAGLGRTGINPADIGKSTIERFYSEKGGETERKTWEYIEQGEKHYATARELARQALLKGKKFGEVKEMLHDQNQKALEILGKIETLNLPIPKGQNINKFKKSITFSQADFERLINQLREEKKGKSTNISRRLTGK